MAVDYGTRRCGIAVTDPLQIIAEGLDTVPTDAVIEFISSYFEEETVEAIVVGEPLYPDGQPAQIAHLVVGFVRKLRKLFPDLEVVTFDERYTSEEAKEIILKSGAKKKNRHRGLKPGLTPLKSGAGDSILQV